MTIPKLVDRLAPGDHVCWTFDDDIQRRETIAHYVRAGLDRGQKIVCCTGSVPPDTVVADLRRQGIAAGRSLDSGQLRVDLATDSYQGATFDPAAMMETWATEIELARTEGWAGLRVAGDMSWAASPAPDQDRLVSYEAEVNRVFATGYAMALCLYDRRLFTGGALSQLATAHPGAALDTMPPHWSPLLRIRRTADPPGLRLTGEADLSNRRALAAVLSGLSNDLGHRSQPLTIDVSRLRFADGAAAHMLAQTAQAADTDSRLVGCSPELSQVMDAIAARDTAPSPPGPTA